MELVIIGYLIFINVLGFALMGIDKSRAKKKLYRVPEKFFFIVSLIGGAFGSWGGMYKFRHKTMHWYFVIGIPLILLVQIVLVTYYFIIIK